MMKFNITNIFNTDKNTDLIVLIGTQTPETQVIELLNKEPNVQVREAFTSKGVLQNLSGVQLVILGELLPVSGVSHEILQSSLDRSGIPVVSQPDFILNPREWLGRAHLAAAKEIAFLPARQINLINWSGGVGKTTLAMAICKRFVQNTGLPAALLELSMGGSALHARVSPDLPEFFAIATHKEKPALWQGVSLYPMDGRSIEVLWGEDPEGLRKLLAEIRHNHTLFVVDCFPGHPLFPELTQSRPGLFNLVVTSPRDDAILQARRVLKEIPEPGHLILNMAKSMADRAESGVSVFLPHNETWATSLDHRLADPILNLVYKGWKVK
jgi:hypothetical protein